ncbi:hypothetical protein ACRQTN_07220 [Pectobacterium brasiliense]|uniref:GAP1-N1 domain-containing protein n=1 Tax=Pectobacterium brasiliense TaxID=180957 RepID=UPI003EBC1EA7
MINKPIKAIYGCKGNSHDLLSFQGSDTPPRQLLGWTDMPSGHISPKEEWWPAINCGAIDDKWWALWNIVPDMNATRSGMVKSEVFLWRLNVVDQVDDISEYVFQLIEETDCEEPSEQFLSNLIQTMIVTKDIIVVDNIATIPNIIIFMWKILWKNAKRNFSVRMAFSPPQMLVNSKHPSFYCVPTSLKNQWYLNNTTIIDSNEAATYLCATKYLISGNTHDETFEELLFPKDELPSDLNFLYRLSRAVDNIEKYKNLKDFDSTVSALRTIILCAPLSNKAETIKRELLDNIKVELKESLDYQKILSLSNLDDLALPQGMMPEMELTSWVKCSLTSLDNEQTVRFLERCNRKPVHWWQASVLKGIKFILDDQNKANHTFRWLGIEDFKEIFESINMDRDKFSDNIYFAMLKCKINDNEATTILSWAEKYQWAKPHALALLKLEKQDNIFDRQYMSMPNWADGIPYLIEHLDDKILFQLTENERFSPFIDLLAKKIAANKSMLYHLDFNRENHFELWIKQLELGGAFYPLKSNNELFCGEICEHLTESISIKTFKIISKEISKFVLFLLNRDLIWSQLSDVQSNILADDLVLHMLPYAKTATYIRIEGKYLLVALEKYFDTTCNIEPKLLATYLSQKTYHDQYKTSAWFDKLSDCNWNEDLHYLCKLISKNKWTIIANRIFISSYGLHPTTPQFRNGIQCFSDLLGLKNRLTLMLSKNYQSTTDKQDLIKYVAEVCAELAHDRLEYFWTRAGGQISKLKLYGNASEQWLYAANLAEHGSLDGGLKALINELLDEYPRNDTLLKIIELLR